jgi:hypothetical protein
MRKHSNHKPGRFVELVVTHFEQILGRGAKVLSPDRIMGRDSGRVREVDVTLRRKVGSADVLIAIECRDRNTPADVRWIDELVTKGRDVGASRVVAVSSSGFSKAARQCADVHGILLRELTEISAEDVDRWFVRTQASIPQWQYVGSIISTRDPELPEIIIRPEDPGPVFHIPPVEEPRALALFWQPVLQQILESAHGVGQIPRDGSKRLLTIRQAPENSDSIVVTSNGTYPLVAIEAVIVCWMEPLTPTSTQVLQYKDEQGVLGETSSYVYPMPDGFCRISITVTDEQGEYLSEHAKEQEPQPEAVDKRKRRK